MTKRAPRRPRSRLDYRALFYFAAEAGLWDRLDSAPDDAARIELLLAAISQAKPGQFVVDCRPAIAGRAAWDLTPEERLEVAEWGRRYWQRDER